MNRDGILDVLQQPQVGHSAPVLYGAPVNFGSAMTVVGCCVYRFPSFPRLDHDAVVFPWGGFLEPVATERRVSRVCGLQSPLRR